MTQQTTTAPIRIALNTGTVTADVELTADLDNMASVTTPRIRLETHITEHWFAPGEPESKLWCHLDPAQAVQLAHRLVELASPGPRGHERRIGLHGLDYDER